MHAQQFLEDVTMDSIAARRQVLVKESKKEPAELKLHQTN
jgi:hypothetical protein